MNRAQGKLLLWPLCLLVLTAMSGCADYIAPSWMPWDRQVDSHPGVVAPADQLADLRELADGASSKSMEERSAIEARLTKAIETERDPLIRAEIVRTLGSYPGRQSDRVLTAAVSGDPSTEVRIAACEALGKRGGRGVAEKLGEVLQGDTDNYVRLAAIEALGQTRDRAAVAPLGEALADKDPALQRRAVLSLKEVTGEDYGNDVNRWQQYVNGEQPAPPEPVSFAESMRQMF